MQRPRNLPSPQPRDGRRRWSGLDHEPRLFGRRLGSIGLENAGGVVRTASHCAEVGEVVVVVRLRLKLRFRSRWMWRVGAQAQGVREMDRSPQGCCQEWEKVLSDVGSGDQEA